MVIFVIVILLHSFVLKFQLALKEGRFEIKFPESGEFLLSTEDPASCEIVIKHVIDQLRSTLCASPSDLYELRHRTEFFWHDRS